MKHLFRTYLERNEGVIFEVIRKAKILILDKSVQWRLAIKESNIIGYMF